MEQPEVQILMATYNGAAYIEEQIHSLQAQTFSNWELLIHDDGSTDATLTIVAGLCERDNRIRVLADNVTNIGAAHNFLHLLAHTDSDIVMLCDQDDIWLPEKINAMLTELKLMDGPALIYANAYYLTRGTVIKRLVTRLHPTTLNNFLFINAGIQGCSMMINRALINRLDTVPQAVAMHDHLLTLAAVCFGRVRYMDAVLMLYRQHDENATTHHVNRWRQLKKWLFTMNGVVDRRHYEANSAFYSQYKSQLSKTQQEIFEEYFKFVRSNSVVERIQIVWRNQFSLGGHQAALLLKILLRKTII